MAVDWADAASRLLKSEIAREGVTLAQLARRLQRLGAQETEASVKNKLYRGTFSAVFFFQCLTALDSRSVDFSALLSADVPRGSALDAGDSN